MAAAICRPFVARGIMAFASRIAMAPRFTVAPAPVRHLSKYGVDGDLVGRLRSADLSADADIDDMYYQDLPVPVQRRVLALKDIQQKFDELNKEFHKEKAELENKYFAKYSPLFDDRAAIVAAKKAVDKYDLPDSTDADEGIPEFWSIALQNSEVVGPTITQRDLEVLKYLTDIRAKAITGEQHGFVLEFYFAENEFFSNDLLTKTYYLEPADEVIPQGFTGCKIDWKPNKDVTVNIVKKRVQDRKLKGKAPPTIVTSTEPTESFFNFFNPPAVPENPNDLSQEDLEELQDRLNNDYECGIAIKERVLLRAVEWYTGEAAPPPEDEGEYEEGEDEDEDYEQEEAPPPPPASKKGGPPPPPRR